MAVVGVGFYLFSAPLAGLFTNDPSVRQLGADYLRINAVCEPFMALGMVLTGALQGAGDTVRPDVHHVLYDVDRAYSSGDVADVPSGIADAGRVVVHVHHGHHRRHHDDAPIPGRTMEEDQSVILLAPNLASRPMPCTLFIFAAVQPRLP